MFFHRRHGRKGRVPSIMDPSYRVPGENFVALMDQGTIRTSYPYDPFAMGDPAACVADTYRGFTNANYPTEPVYLPDESVRAMDNRYCIGAQIVWWRGKCRVAGAQNRSIHEENNKNERVVESVSDDGQTWTYARVRFLAPNPGDGVHCYSHGAYFPHVESDKLYYLAPYYEGVATAPNHFKNLQTALFRLDNENSGDGTWTLVGIISTGFPLETPKKMANGNWICVASDANARPAVIISQGDNITAWWHQRPIGNNFQAPAYDEGNTFFPALGMPGEVRVVLRQPRGTNMYGSVSYDYGWTWENAVIDGLQAQNKKPSALRLPNGVLIIGVTSDGLDNWIIYFSLPGQDMVVRSYDINAGNPPLVTWKYDPGDGTPGFVNLGLELGYSANRIVDGVIVDKPEHRRAWAYGGVTVHGSDLEVVTHENHERFRKWSIPIGNFIVPDAIDGPVAWWKLDDAGSTISDSSGYGHNGVSYNTPLRVRGPKQDTYGQCFSLASTVTITIASPAVVTWASHGLQTGRAIFFSTGSALPTGLVAGTTYYVKNAATNTFEVSASPGGASINTSGTQAGTQTATTVTGYVSVPLPTRLSTFLAFSVSIRFKVLSLSPSADKTIIGCYVSGGRAWRLYIHYNSGSQPEDKNKLAWLVSPRGGSTTLYTREMFTPALNIWYHAVVDSTGAVRLNGAPAQTASESGTVPPYVYMPHSQGLLISADGIDGAPADQARSVISDVRVYNRLLSDQEVADIYNAPEWDPRSNVKPTNTTQIAAVKSRAAAGIAGPGRFFDFGDSTSIGQSAGDSGAGLYYNQVYNNRHCVSARALRDAGYPSRHDAIIGAATNSFTNQNVSDFYAGRVVIGSPWFIGTFAATGSGLGAVTGSVGGYYFRATSGGGVLSFTSIDAWDSVELYFARSNAAFSFTYEIDGGAQTTVSRTYGGTVASLYNEKIVISAGSPGVHTINIRWVSGSVAINGVIFVDSTAPKIQFITAGWPGGDVQDMNSTKYLSAVNQIANYTNGEPCAFFYNLGINSLIDGDDLTAIGALDRSMIDKFKSSGDAVMIGFNPINSYPTQATLIADHYAVSIEKDIPMIDFSLMFGPYAEAAALGQMYDSYHPNKAGHAREAQWVTAFLMSV